MGVNVSADTSMPDGSPESPESAGSPGSYPYFERFRKSRVRSTCWLVTVAIEPQKIMILRVWNW